MKLDPEQVKKASKALVAYLEKNPSTPANSLVEASESFFLQIALKKIPESATVKPFQIPLKHKLHSDSVTVCLIVKDPHGEIKDYVAEKGIGEVTKVIGIQKLKTHYKSYESRRELCKSYDLFLADDRVLPLLPKLLGKVFFESKKNPAPIKAAKNKIEKEVKRAVSSTYLRFTKGSNLTIRIGTSEHSAEQIAENIIGAIDLIVGRIPRKWANILSIGLKTTNSVSLPIYNSLPSHAKALPKPKNPTSLKDIKEVEPTSAPEAALSKEDKTKTAKAESLVEKVVAKVNRAQLSSEAIKSKKSAVKVTPSSKARAKLALKGRK
ncbi:ribosomal protein L1p/L10e family-domain-containing protein [Polychytrium aggregatum]|uniref:ribosomal protein L1p/L10e family-domain-containing protein n=1 Tax=Polychytrium aggregatum TaxID=110093 RepID=UPI0022FDF379|nr:ribosomal protein L1p/L10e family-domain-containing protein [Polychytrium aggregatum]KAI9208873.1 ribosomal protein L1p/L10e family-domain-containing protein [Polychytrium aggregatum]